MTLRKITTALIWCLLSGLAVSAKAEQPREQVYSLFAQANEAFRQANATNNTAERQQLYDKAILNFEKVINDGRIKNAKLYYNLANAYLLKHDIGRAILNYRLAEELDNSNTDIKKNLAFARSLRVDKVELKSEKRILQTLFFWHYDLSIKIKFLLACVFFFIICLNVTLLIWRGKSPSVITTALVAGFLVICFSSSVFVDTYNQANRIFGVITAQEIVARQGDGPNYPPSFKEPLHAGTEFNLLERRPSWLHIRLFDNSDTWIPDTAGITSTRLTAVLRLR
jgi:tetratricopeptide (TPR) repeat protein